MIRQVFPAGAAPEDAAFVQGKAAVPGFGPPLAVDWALAAQNPSLPAQFYRVDGSALLLHAPGGSTLLGAPEDPAELDAFLTLLGVQDFLSDGYALPGRAAAPCRVMVWNPALAPAPAPLKNLEQHPEPGDLMGLLANAAPPPARYNALYAALCVRLNHGYADALAARKAPGGPLVSCAVAYSLTQTDAGIAGVATLPPARGHGLAGALVLRLCRRYQGRRVTLVCEAPLAAWYRRLGFAESPAAALKITTSPTGEHHD